LVGGAKGPDDWWEGQRDRMIGRWGRGTG